MTEHTVAIVGLKREEGYSMIELLISLIVLMIISGTVMDGVLRLTRTNQTVANRSEMHAGVRNVTELLQQEVGQAGRITIPTGLTIANAINTASLTTTGLLLGGVDTTTFYRGLVDVPGHASRGGYRGQRGNGRLDGRELVKQSDHGKLPQAATTWARPSTSTADSLKVWCRPATANGSTDSILKIFGDINGTGNMVYIEYECDINAGRLYRRSMPITATAKPALTPDQTLLNNIVANPGGTRRASRIRRTRGTGRRS